jgi:hypothetical protein
MIFKCITLLILLGITQEGISAAAADAGEAEDTASHTRITPTVLRSIEDIRREFESCRAQGEEEAKKFAIWLGETLILKDHHPDAVNDLMRSLGAQSFYSIDHRGSALDVYKNHLTEKRLVEGLETALSLGEKATEAFLRYVFHGTIEENPRALPDGRIRAHIFTPGNCYRSEAVDRSTHLPLHLKCEYAEEQVRSPDGQWWEAVTPTTPRKDLEKDLAYRTAFKEYPHSMAVLMLHNQISTGEMDNPFKGPMGRFVVNMFSDKCGGNYLDVRDATISPAYQGFFGTPEEGRLNKTCVHAWNVFIYTIWQQMEAGRLPLNLVLLASASGPGQEEGGFPLFAGETTPINHLLTLGFESGDQFKGNFGDETLNALYKGRYLLSQLAVGLRVIDDLKNPPRRRMVEGSEKQVTLPDGKMVWAADTAMVGGGQAPATLRRLYDAFGEERKRLVEERERANREAQAGAGGQTHDPADQQA